MSNLEINIQNCNNINNGSISILSNKLNILFGCNGTGKSTVARAIYLVSQGKSLNELTPYGINDENMAPEITGYPTGNISIFDDEYVNQYVFQPDTLIKDTFEVLVRSPEYDEAKKNIDSALVNIKTTITNRKEFIELQNHIGVLLEKIKFTNSNKIVKKGGAKSVLEGKGAYFNPPAELDDLKPFFEDDTVSKWAAWRLQGYEQYGKKGRCPYCSTGDTTKTETINKVFFDSFDKTSVETAALIIAAVDKLKPYLNDEKTSELISLFGVKQNIDALEAQLTKLCIEANYLHGKLTAILSFNGSSVERDNIADLETKLTDMKIISSVIETFFTKELTISLIKSINDEIDSLLINVGVLKGEIAKYNSHIQDKINDRKQDINEFLSIAGFNYSFDVEVNGENDAKALLRFILPDGNPANVQSPKEHLSWGEKHAFSLILFMFDAISKNSELIILDDPISSFDSNKKYAIINRLFITGDRENSLYQRTVLLLTHDFEPVIDYIQVRAGQQDPSTICATYFENLDGLLQCTPICRNSDLLSSVVLLKELAKDDSIDIAARIGCLRKFLEHQYKNPREESEAYNILSSLTHGRSEPTHDNEGLDKLTEEQIAEGENFIRDFIVDFNYSNVLSSLSQDSLIHRYFEEPIAYVKMLILRAYTEQSVEARKRLRQSNDVLRKYVDETYHIENDYLYSLDIRRFNIVPNNYISEADKYVTNEKAILYITESEK